MMIVAWALISIAVGLLWISRRMRLSTGIPNGQLIYADSENWQSIDEPLFDSRLGLVGRPDYIIRNGEDVVPIEIKSGRTPEEPYENHVYQLGAYCILAHRKWASRPAYGLLKYNHKTFRVDFTDELEDAVLTLIAQMRSEKLGTGSDRSHELPQRCKNCAYRSQCDQRLI